MEGSTISFKATVNGLILIMQGEDDFEAVCRQIEKKLESSGRFFKGASINVKYRGRRLTAEQELEVRELMSKKTNAEIKSFEEDATPPEKEPEEQEKEKGVVKPRMKMLYFKGIDEGMTKFYKGTVRSGQRVGFEGNLVIIGDVHPGGEVLATGNVIVMGSLRGVVHAGADGNKKAIVAALNLQPTQLRIADVITRPPDTKEAGMEPAPEIAVIRDDMVYIERFLPQYK